MVKTGFWLLLQLRKKEITYENILRFIAYADMRLNVMPIDCYLMRYACSGDRQ